MSYFNDAVLFVLSNEGQYSNVKHDKGGATNYGVSTRLLKQIDKDINGDGHVNGKDAAALTKPGAIEIYKEHFWDHYKLDRISNILVAKKAFDLFVNMRGKAAGKILQRACKNCGLTLKIDGIVGSKSVKAINSLSMFGVTREKLLSEIRKEQASFYGAIVKANKTQRKFLKGWLRRAAR
ncbi:hypothetical protein KAR91_75890 [Candidatus Pacearchaeota archaeon]|nr:hypothetical protein [Candidatus Pacearchaeota archaeon]